MLFMTTGHKLSFVHLWPIWPIRGLTRGLAQRRRQFWSYDPRFRRQYLHTKAYCDVNEIAAAVTDVHWLNGQVAVVEPVTGSGPGAGFNGRSWWPSWVGFTTWSLENLI